MSRASVGKSAGRNRITPLPISLLHYRPLLSQGPFPEFFLDLLLSFL